MPEPRTRDLNLRLTEKTGKVLIATQAAMMARLSRKVTMTEVVEAGLALIAKKEKVAQP